MMMKIIKSLTTTKIMIPAINLTKAIIYICIIKFTAILHEIANENDVAVMIMLMKIRQTTMNTFFAKFSII